MKIFIYANCQGRGIQKFLELFLQDSTSLEITFMENWRVLNGDLNVNDFLPALSAADLFIYQPLSAGHGVFSTAPDQDSIFTKTRKECQKISFAYLLNSGFWPFYIDGNEIVNGSVLDQYLLDGATCDDILTFYDERRIFFDLAERTRASFEIHRDREQCVDIKINDFLMKNFKDRRLFMTHNHPTTACFTEITGKILEMLLRKPKRDLSHYITNLDQNVTNLPGKNPIDQYSIRELGLTYISEAEAEAEISYKNIIRKYCHEWKMKLA